ncbi:MAG: hypothetical protein ACR2RL_21560 [Gammaproteobacteria bacterium]
MSTDDKLPLPRQYIDKILRESDALRAENERLKDERQRWINQANKRAQQLADALELAEDLHSNVPPQCQAPEEMDALRKAVGARILPAAQS